MSVLQAALCDLAKIYDAASNDAISCRDDYFDGSMLSREISCELSTLGMMLRFLLGMYVWARASVRHVMVQESASTQCAQRTDVQNVIEEIAKMYHSQMA